MILGPGDSHFPGLFFFEQNIKPGTPVPVQFNRPHKLFDKAYYKF